MSGFVPEGVGLVLPSMSVDGAEVAVPAYIPADDKLKVAVPPPMAGE